MEPTNPKTATILLVEDNPGDAELAREALENSKFINQLHVAEDGVQAMDFLHRQGPYADAPRPDIILLDLNLPKKDGREVLAEIKSDEKLKTIPVVILTSSKADEDVIRSYKLHANCYITKPLDISRFFNVVNNIKEFWMSIVVLPHDEE
ncbi:response regulator [uncultured Desulfobacter sp.]|uniref:response regulator n=1 Tax=uncultured Desulfobacter sp. TaxID=240139 RepID=UPI002AA788B9|nr:response regulator [uncultured Desulfobacter sp.]